MRACVVFKFLSNQCAGFFSL